MNQILVNIIVGLISAFFGVIITFVFQKKFKVRQTKIELLSNIFAYRYQLTPGYKGEEQKEIISLLNESMIVFYKSSEIIRALNNYLKSKKPEDIILVLNLMLNNLKIKNDLIYSMIEQPFGPRKEIN